MTARPARQQAGGARTPRVTLPDREPTTVPQPGRRGPITVGVRDRLYARGYHRPRQHRILGGVCAGLGQRWGLTPWVTRWLFVVLLVLLPGSPLVIYPLLWILMPDELPVRR